MQKRAARLGISARCGCRGRAQKDGRVPATIHKSGRFDGRRERCGRRRGMARVGGTRFALDLNGGGFA
jgi:hypothetical protein